MANEQPANPQSPAGPEPTPGPAANSGAPANPPAAGESGTPAAPGGQSPTSSAGPPADALSDGTKPTILHTGDSHKPVPKGKVSLTTVYRRADVFTTLLTFAGAIIAGALILGGYAYFTRNNAKPSSTPKVTSLSQTDLNKLDSFFSGNSAGTNSEVLTISSSSLFKNRVAVASDLKVVGGLQVSGTTAVADLTVDKNATLGATNVRGALVVAGPANLQSPATFGAGATITGNLGVTGNGSFGGSVAAGTLNVRDLSVTGTLNLAGHLSMSGQNPSASPASNAVSTASVSGNDTSGTVTINMPPTANQDLGAQLVTVTFRAAYPRAPNVVITPVGRGAALFQPYVLKTATNFTIGAAVIPSNGNATSYSFDYWVAQ